MRPRSEIETLKLVALAANYEIDFENHIDSKMWFAAGYDENGDVAKWWNPLYSDGDAFRLFIDLNLTPYAPTQDYPYACCQDLGADIDVNINVVSGDKADAMRRAIVRAAYDVGRRMTGQ